VAVSVFAPAATSPALGGTIELLDVVTGGVVSSVRLPGGSEVESMALPGGSLFVATGTGASSDVRRLPAPKLRTSGRSLGSGTGMPTTLESISLDSSGGIVWASDQTALVCLDPSTGRALASTAPPSLLSAVVTAGATTYAVTGSGIGELRPPAAC
jgi:hypothetical protein